ncbi:MAG: alpha-amylase family glycosyl hydrolase, partial [Candidatus Kapaibacteriota bacterium]
MNRHDSLKLVYEKVSNCELSVGDYWIPSIWINSSEHFGIRKIEPRSFFLNSIETIIDLPQKFVSNFDKTIHNPLVYNMLLRYTTTFDHNNDGRISIEKLNGQLYETGTLLKSIAILPYLKSLGVDIIYLLPINEIGVFGRKGILGSPYAYKHPFKIDTRLGEPFLDLSLDEQFKAFVQAVHTLGMKIVLEFVLRTISIDNDLAIEHPDWFYWIKIEEAANYKPPFIQNLPFKIPDPEDLPIIY